MIHLRSGLAMVVCLLGMNTAVGQWGIRTGFGVEWLGKPLAAQWVIGVDRDVSGRSGVGLDLLWGVNIYGTGGYQDMVTTGNTYVNYVLEPRVRGLQLRSFYFLSDDSYGAYVGSYVGFRNVKRNLRISPENDPFTPGNADRDHVLSNVVIPVGLRIGLRGELDGWYQDLYVGIGYVVGHGGMSS